MDVPNPTRTPEHFIQDNMSRKRRRNRSTNDPKRSLQWYPSQKAKRMPAGTANGTTQAAILSTSSKYSDCMSDMNQGSRVRSPDNTFALCMHVSTVECFIRGVPGGRPKQTREELCTEAARRRSLTNLIGSSIVAPYPDSMPSLRVWRPRATHFEAKCGGAYASAILCSLLTSAARLHYSLASS